MNQHKPWSQEETEFLKNNYRVLPVLEISKKLNRTLGATRTRIQKLGLSEIFVNRDPIEEDGIYLIPLYTKTNKEVLYSLVDKESLVLIKGYKWHAMKGIDGYKSMYAVAHTNPGMVRMHKLILPCPEGYEIDHINFNGLDNRKENLRLATKSQSMAHRRQFGNKYSRYKGVRFIVLNNSRSVWIAYLGDKYLKTCKTEIEAAKEYDKAAKEKYGEFAVLNFPENLA